MRRSFLIFWVALLLRRSRSTVDENRLIAACCGTLQLIAAHCGSLRLTAAHGGGRLRFGCQEHYISRLYYSCYQNGRICVCVCVCARAHTQACGGVRARNCESGHAGRKDRMRRCVCVRARAHARVTASWQAGRRDRPAAHTSSNARSSTRQTKPATAFVQPLEFRVSSTPHGRRDGPAAAAMRSRCSRAHRILDALAGGQATRAGGRYLYQLWVLLHAPPHPVPPG